MASPALTFEPLSRKVPNSNCQFCYGSLLQSHSQKHQTFSSCSMKQPLGSQIRFCASQVYLSSYFKNRRGDYRASILCSMKFPRIEQFDDSSNYKMYMDYVKGRVLELTPEPVKSFPFKKAAEVASQQLLTMGREALKLALVAVFIFGTLSDIISSISRNKELVVPFALLVGCTIAEFLKDITNEFVYSNKEEDVTWCLLGMSCIFILLKSIDIRLPMEGLGFVSHVANGAMMQILWHLKSSGKRNDATQDESLVNEMVEN